MCQAGTPIKTIPRSTPHIAALVLPIPAFTQVTVIIPGGCYTTRTTRSPDLTMRSSSSRRTDAGIAGNAVDAGGAIGAGVAGALVDVDPAIGTGETRCALAPKPVDPVHTPSSVQTGEGLAVVHVPHTVRSLESFPADAPVTTVRTVDTGCTVGAGVAGARRGRYVTG